MTGMKDGAGEDPFAEDDTSDADEATPESESPDTAAEPPFSIPYKFRRDSVQDGRQRVPLFIQPETKDAEREALRQFEDEFGETVSLTDVREALVRVGLNRLDEVESQLEAWGYGMTFEE